MEHVYWLGGSSCAGKSTCAAALAEKHGLLVVGTDDLCFGRFLFDNPKLDSYPATRAYRDRILSGMDSFARTDVSTSLQGFLKYCEEVFPLLVEDVRTRRADQGILVEGAHLLPHLAKN